MQLCITLLLFITVIACLKSLSDATAKTKSQVNARRNAKPIPLKGKQLPNGKSQGKAGQQAKLPNAKRWMPSKKNNVKYVPKLANNTKRWMPGFADMGQSEMESSMMYDAGYVSNDPPASYSPQQQPSNEFALPQGISQSQQQGLPPEQSFLTPAATETGLNLPGQDMVGRGSNQYQNVGNEIESFAKEGFDANGVSQMYNSYDFQDSVLNNPKFQEGDYIGTPVQENSNKANLYDAFNIEPGMAENFVSPAKANGGNDAGKSEGGGKNGKDEDKESKHEEKEISGKEEKDAEKNEKSSEAGKKESKTSEKVMKESKTNEKVMKESKSNEKETKNGKAKAVTGSQKEVEKSSAKNEKESNEVSDAKDNAKDDKEKGKEKKEEKEEKEENVKKLTKDENADESGKGEEKEKNLKLNDSKELGNEEKLVVNKNDEGEEGAKGKEKNTGTEDEKVSESNSEGEEKNENEADDEKKVKNAKSLKVSKKLKNVSITKVKKLAKNVKQSQNEKNGEENDEDQLKGGKSKQDEKIANEEEGDQKEANLQQVTDSSKAELEEENSKNTGEQEDESSKNKADDQNADAKEDRKGEETSRIKKLKQRINTQKLMKNHGRLQQDAAARYKISTDADNSLLGNALSSNVAPANTALGTAAEGLRKQLVSNLRNALMKNMAAAMARGGNVNGAEDPSAVGQSMEMKQNMKPEMVNGGGAKDEQQQQHHHQLQQQQHQQQQQQQQQLVNEKQGGNGLSSYQDSKGQGESKTDGKEGENQSGNSNAKEERANQSLVPTLMKMDKTTLVDTILKLLKKTKEGGKETGAKQMMGGSDNGDKDEKEDEQSGGTINQSLQNQQGTDSGNMQDQNPETKESGVKDESKDGQEDSGKTEDVKQPKTNSNQEEDSGHAEYSMYPVKADGSTKYYKFKKLQGQGHIKGNLAHAPKKDDPYAQIGLADPSNNDKITTHHKSSSLKDDLDRQETKASKLTGNKEESTDDQSNQESPNQETDSKQSTMSPRLDQSADGDQQSNENEEQASNANQENANQQFINQPNQVGNQESTKVQKTEKDSPIQQSMVTDQDGVTTETNINADSPKMVAQLMKISQRLHDINNKKAAQSDQKESSNSQEFGNSNRIAGLAQMSRDDAYSTIGSFDPNVKKKAAIGKKKLDNTKKMLNTLESNEISKRT